jgi:hypothetical protein
MSASRRSPLGLRSSMLPARADDACYLVHRMLPMLPVIDPQVLFEIRRLTTASKLERFRRGDRLQILYSYINASARADDADAEVRRLYTAGHAPPGCWLKRRTSGIPIRAPWRYHCGTRDGTRTPHTASRAHRRSNYVLLTAVFCAVSFGRTHSGSTYRPPS